MNSYRYRMLETIQEYARGRLREEADSAATHLRHCDYFTAMAQTAKPALDNPGRDRSMWLKKLDLEQDNFRAALTWSLAEPKANEAALQLCGLLEQFWLRQAQSREGSKWCDAAVTHAGGARCTPIYAKALLAAGTFAYRLGDYGAARISLERAIAVAEAVGDRILQTEALIRLGNAASMQSNFAQAEATFQKAIAVCQETGDRRQECSVLRKLGNIRINQGDLAGAAEPLRCSLSLSRELSAPAFEALVLNLMAEEAWYRGDLGVAEQHAQQCLSIVQAMGDQTGEADPLRNLAKIARARGDFKEARKWLLDSFAASREHGDPQYLDEIALMAMALSKPEHAAHFAGAADALRHAFGLDIWPVDRERFHEYRDQCRNLLGKARYDEVYFSARALNPDAVIGMTRAWLEHIDVELAPPQK